jgi:hypothetical protein
MRRGFFGPPGMDMDMDMNTGMDRDTRDGNEHKALTRTPGMDKDTDTNDSRVLSLTSQKYKLLTVKALTL